MLLVTRKREIEAALGGPLAVADIDEGSFIAKLWLIASRIASFADAVPLARIGENALR
ncbi:MAG: hypothetical protein SXG53_08405 [Pseudomonadota bacterium]|nr:hypothetical protein [Pseudomonadota bacterium]